MTALEPCELAWRAWHGKTYAAMTLRRQPLFDINKAGNLHVMPVLYSYVPA
jgi:hypothetical protein